MPDRTSQCHEGRCDQGQGQRTVPDKIYQQIQVCCKYCNVPKFSDARKHCCNLPIIQTKRLKLRLFGQKDANGIANSEDPDQTAPLGAV